MDNPKASAVGRLKESSNVLVTVSTNPSVDQLAGAIGLTLLLNKLGKHATAVFSGDIPSTIEFLRPEETIERNTDSLRDFIISLDKAKADKLRYKVEEKLVRIFITPYHTSLSHEDLEFSLGDFNVDVIVALGVHEQQDLDQAISAHGRILHDATIITINTQPNGNLGTIGWVDPQASSLSEMLADLGLTLKSDVLDAQMATALLTGIVAETDRFSNQRTTSATMSLSAKLMAAGANQQLVATKLQESSDNMLPEAQPASYTPPTDEPNDDEDTNADGSLRIDHDGPIGGGSQDNSPTPPKTDEPKDVPPAPDDGQDAVPDTPKIMMDPPSMGGTLTASGQSDNTAANTNPLSLPPVDTPLLRHDSDESDKKNQDELIVDNLLNEQAATPEPSAVEPPKPVEENSKTLEEIEQAVDSPHIKQETQEANPQPLNINENVAEEEGSAAEGAQPVDLDLGHNLPPSATVSPTAAAAPGIDHQYLDVNKLDEETGLPASSESTDESSHAANSQGYPVPPQVPPPLVPPPIMPTSTSMRLGDRPFGDQDDNQSHQPLAPL